jgi:hypothetical protein
VNGWTERAKALIKNGADVDVPVFIPTWTIDKQKALRLSVLDVATSTDQWNVVELLRRYGAKE